MERFSTSLLGQADTLLLATDGSPFSDGAIQEAIFFGQACRYAGGRSACGATRGGIDSGCQLHSHATPEGNGSSL